MTPFAQLGSTPTIEKEARKRFSGMGGTCYGVVASGGMVSDAKPLVTR